VAANGTTSGKVSAKPKGRKKTATAKTVTAQRGKTASAKGAIRATNGTVRKVAAKTPAAKRS
jgi:hypothetical protein